MSLTLECTILWYVTPCSPVVHRRFGGTYSLDLKRKPNKQPARSRRQTELYFVHRLVEQVSPTPHMRTETDPVSETLCFFVFI
jgi:hypothetical protein